ncbi:DUF4465 domain-containing protein [Botrimarina mediterranea]|uniref:PEP-CTERM protein-sorting domain-containing protein n=1 Tax=Botrimarina mediterranea TaxID=2528022 RepID=A0A518KDY2_9BACT|nr:DUF4465 domain-containing protein [Botrimarina mediterranea]QDV75998.1 hypothetical protein Spa11_42220 [Botrimarina mediterranea]QDV80593.1 hypothetical protein K2D_42230 [Planctomycetes bacterium K2D]
MNLRHALLSLSLLLAGSVASAHAAQSVVDFDDLTLAPESRWVGPDPNGDTVDGAFGPEVRGAFASHGAAFGNVYDLSFSTWSGFAYSNESDNTTPGFGNQHSAITGDGHGPGADNYGLAFAASTLGSGPIDAAALAGLPTITLPSGHSVESVWITNTTYAALSMRDGDSFAKKFGGESGTDEDWFMVTAYGVDAEGGVLDASVDFYLADFRSANSAEDYLVTDWTEWDLSPLAGAASLHFDFSSSDVGAFGINTPTYFAIDDLTLNTIPEPASILLVAIGCVAIAARKA